MNADALKKLTTESLNQLAALLPIDDVRVPSDAGRWTP
jgi:hypothetical protein